MYIISKASNTFEYVVHTNFEYNVELCTSDQYSMSAYLNVIFEYKLFEFKKKYILREQRLFTHSESLTSRNSNKFMRILRFFELKNFRGAGRGAGST